MDKKCEKLRCVECGEFFTRVIGDFCSKHAQPPTSSPPSEPGECQDCDVRYECNTGLGCILKMSPKSSTVEKPE